MRFPTTYFVPGRRNYLRLQDSCFHLNAPVVDFCVCESHTINGRPRKPGSRLSARSYWFCDCIEHTLSVTTQQASQAYVQSGIFLTFHEGCWCLHAMLSRYPGLPFPPHRNQKNNERVHTSPGNHQLRAVHLRSSCAVRFNLVRREHGLHSRC